MKKAILSEINVEETAEIPAVALKISSSFHPAHTVTVMSTFILSVGVLTPERLCSLTQFENRPEQSCTGAKSGCNPVIAGFCVCACVRAACVPRACVRACGRMRVCAEKVAGG